MKRQLARNIWIKEQSVKMKYNVEHKAEIEGLVYSVCKEEDFAEAEDFFWNVFFKSEPASQSYGGYRERDPAMAKQFYDIVGQGVSVIVRDPANNNKMVGTRIAHAVKRC